MSSTRRIAVIIGAGPGLATSIAKQLSSTHSLVLLSRSLPNSLSKLNLPSTIPKENILALSSDGSATSLKKAFEDLKKHWPNGKVDIGIYNVNQSFGLRDFLDSDESQLRAGLESGVVGGWNFSQSIIPLFLSNEPDEITGARGVLLFTGATMSLRGGAKFSSLAPGMFARRSLSQSLAREFGPKGIHVGHIILDGIIETDRVKEMMGEDKDHSRLNPDHIAQTYLSMINQPRTAWTQELDIR
ncbi:uncharacterized protein I206_101873 [Kwoniella pini CBS 10737]|uniref:Short-chain dehydrogenase n=1 Tax=Kwoniella pini CBS 10737 TaxID=1296096 RepID=A0A1B9HVH1_9TREE|nr:short-chain dehydrogenase [Kwoniella pini CBS 10737]OCF47258.1 short-chain dehydrogenase [Kwoniella pini CBS 10737]